MSPMKPDTPEVWSSRFISSLWSDTTRTWESSNEDWRVVGVNPFKRSDDSVSKNSISSDETLYVVEFSSKRLCVGYMPNVLLATGCYVIIEADRGEDCGMIKGTVDRLMYEELVKKYRTVDVCLKPKIIYRVASEGDLHLLSDRQKMVKIALIQCRNHVMTKNLNMEILDCEYQFDLNKITFFFHSNERIDFRELVKDLYKVFKTRIWMCSVDKTKDRLLESIIL